MKLGFALVFLAACGGAGGVDQTPTATVEVVQEEDASTPQVDANTVDQSDAGTPAVVHDAAPDADDSAYVRCAAQLCNSRCGAAGDTCEGRAVDCGACAVATDRCGDNIPNVCGHSCLDQPGPHFVCNALGAPSAWATDYSCTTAPYRFTSIEHRLEMRASGIAGCVQREYMGQTALCCP